MNIATRLRALRIRAGKSRLEMAQSLGIDPAWYEDLEQKDGELTATLTLFQATQLASLLGVRLRELFDAQSSAPSPISLVDLSSRIRSDAAHSRVSIEALEAALGWDLRDFLESPVQVAAELPVAFLMAIAAHLRIDWLSLTPEDDAGEST
jgi:transcriptional regulator with XRE-family HTH domain